MFDRICARVCAGMCVLNGCLASSSLALPAWAWTGIVALSFGVAGLILAIVSPFWEAKE